MAGGGGESVDPHRRVAVAGHHRRAVERRGELVPSPSMPSGGIVVVARGVGVDRALVLLALSVMGESGIGATPRKLGPPPALTMQRREQRREGIQRARAVRVVISGHLSPSKGAPGGHRWEAPTRAEIARIGAAGAGSTRRRRGGVTTRGAHRGDHPLVFPPRCGTASRGVPSRPSCRPRCRPSPRACGAGRRGATSEHRDALVRVPPPRSFRHRVPSCRAEEAHRCPPERDDHLGRTRSSWRTGKGVQARISSCSGTRLGGLHFTMFATYTSSGLRPIATMILSRSWPAGPTKGTLLVLLLAGPLADEATAREGVAAREHRVAPRRREAAGGAARAPRLESPRRVHPRLALERRPGGDARRRGRGAVGSPKSVRTTGAAGAAGATGARPRDFGAGATGAGTLPSVLPTRPTAASARPVAL